MRRLFTLILVIVCAVLLLRMRADHSYERANLAVSITFNLDGCNALKGTGLTLLPGDRPKTCRLAEAALQSESRHDRHLFHLSAQGQRVGVAKSLVLWIDSGGVRRHQPSQ